MKSTDPGFSELTFKEQLEIVMAELFVTRPSFVGITKFEKELAYLKTRTIGIPQKNPKYPIHGVTDHWIATKAKCNRSGVTNDKKSTFECVVDDHFVQVRKFLVFHLVNFPILAMDELSLFILALMEKRGISQEDTFWTLLQLRALFEIIPYPDLNNDKDRSRRIVTEHILQHEHTVSRLDLSELNAKYQLYPDDDPVFYELEAENLILFPVYSHTYTHKIVFCPLIPRELHYMHRFRLWRWDFMIC